MTNKFTGVIAASFIIVMMFFNALLISSNHSRKAQLTTCTYREVSGTVVEQYAKIEMDDNGSPVRFISVIEYNGQRYELADDKLYAMYKVGDEVQFNIVSHYNDEGNIVWREIKTVDED